MVKLSAPEQLILNFAKEKFGSSLTEFLQVGLGEDVTEQRWRFTITFFGESGSLQKRHVEVITYEPEDGSSYLPCRRATLVLLGLLQLLLERGGSSKILRFKPEDLLSLLGWKDTRKARREIDEAIRRYFQLTYRWKMNKGELAANSLSHYTSQESILSEHLIVSEGPEELHQLAFCPHFMEGLLSRSLFSLDWNRVRAVLH